MQGFSCRRGGRQGQVPIRSIVHATCLARKTLEQRVLRVPKPGRECGARRNVRRLSRVPRFGAGLAGSTP